MAQVTLGGNPVEVSANLPQPGETAPDFTLTNPDMEDKTLGNWQGQRKILNIIPSIDTGVCAASTRTFNEKASRLHNTAVLVISADLPFAAARFCGAEELNDVVTLSCFRNERFPEDYGVNLTTGPFRGLCARAVVVLDENNQVLHSQLVPEIGEEPDYDTAIRALT